VATAFIIDYEPFDATLPPTTIYGVRVARDNHLETHQVAFEGVVEILTDLIAKDERVYTIDGSQLLASLIWRRLPDARTLCGYIDQRRIVSTDDLTAVLGLAPDARTRYHTDDPATIALQGEALYDQATATLLASNPHTHPGGINLETLGNAAALCLSWHGAIIDREMLTRLVHAGRNMATHIVANLRPNGTIHPVYFRTRSARFFSRFPAVQSLAVDPFNQHTCPRALVVPAQGHVLAAIDIKSAQLQAITATWKKLFPDDHRVASMDNPADPLDHHQITGSLLKRLVQLPETAPSREVGKAVNFCLINCGGVRGMNEIFKNFGYPGTLDQPTFTKVLLMVAERLPVDIWAQAAAAYCAGGRTTTITGRTFKVKWPGQFSAAHLHALESDAVGIGLLEMLLGWTFPTLLVYDEVLTQVPNVAALQPGTEAFLRGLGRTIPGWNPSLKTTIYPQHWGVT